MPDEPNSEGMPDEQGSAGLPDDDEGPDADAVAARGVPCEVKALLAARCHSCHGSPPFGAPMALVSYEDLMAPAKSNAAVRVIDMVITRMKRGDMPPGAPGPAVDEVALIEAWVARGAEAEVCDDAPAEGDQRRDDDDAGDERPGDDDESDERSADEPEPQRPPPDADFEPGALGLPCDVESLLAARCRGCHSSPPFGAPMALVTYGDLVAPAVSNSSVRVLDLAIARMKQGNMPPFPPAASAGEVAILESWAARGAQPEACGTAEPAEPAEPDTDLPEPQSDDDDEQVDDQQTDFEPGALGLPCGVESVLTARCRGCHSSPPFGAPMALLTYDDLVAPAISNSNARVLDVVIARMKQGSMPPFPPAPSAGEIAVMEAWAERGAQPEACGTPEPAEPDTEPPPTEPDVDDEHGDDPQGDDPQGELQPEALGLSCDVESLLAARCRGCHSSPPVGAPMALVTYDDLVAPAVSNSSVRVLDLVVARMKQGTMPPFPPAPSADEIAVMESWAERGGQPEACGPAEPAEPDTDPPQPEPDDDDEQADDQQVEPSDDRFDSAVICSSGAYYVEEDTNPALMHPGTACLGCHAASGSAPAFTIAGTVYPTAHEPSECRGVDRTAGATVIITGSDGSVLTLPVNSSGNFYSTEPVATPFRAQLRADDGVRAMGTPQVTGDCNSCHTQSGNNGAPGRIVLP